VIRPRVEAAQGSVNSRGASGPRGPCAVTEAQYPHLRGVDGLSLLTSMLNGYGEVLTVMEPIFSVRGARRHNSRHSGSSGWRVREVPIRSVDVRGGRPRWMSKTPRGGSRAPPRKPVSDLTRTRTATRDVRQGSGRRDVRAGAIFAPAASPGSDRPTGQYRARARILPARTLLGSPGDAPTSRGAHEHPPSKSWSGQRRGSPLLSTSLLHTTCCDAGSKSPWSARAESK